MTEKLVSVRVRAITDEYKREMNEASATTKRWSDDVAASTERVGKKMQAAGAGMTAGVTLPLLALGKQAVSSASDLQEASNVAGLVFGDMRDEIDAAADASVELAGLSKRAYFEAASGVGGLLDNLGFGREETVKWSQDLVTLAADMGSAFNTSTEDAIQAIGAGLRGEAEPLKRFNVFLSQTELATKAVEMGLANTTGEVDRNAKAQAALNLIMEQTATVQGDWANTQDETAGSLKKARAEWENATAALGEQLLPVVADAAGFVADLLEQFQNLPPSVQENIVKFGGLAAAAGPLMVVAGTLLRNFKSIQSVLGSRTTGMAGKLFLAATAAYALDEALQSVMGWGPEDLTGLSREVDRFIDTGNAEGIERLVGNFDDIGEALGYVADRSLWESIHGGMNRFLDSVPIIGASESQWSEWPREIAALDAALADLVSSGRGDDAATLMGQINDAAERQGVNLENLGAAFPNYTREVEIAGAAAGDAAGNVDDLGNEQATLESTTRDATEAMKDQFEELRAQADPVFALQKSIGDLEEAQAGYNAAVDEFGPNSEEARAAAGDMGTAFLGTRDAAMRAQESFGPGFVTRLQDLASEMGLTAPQVDGLTDLVLGLAGSADEYAGDYRATFAADTAVARAELDLLIAKLGALRDAGSHVSVPGTNLGGHTAFHTGGTVQPGDLLRLPGMAPDEGLARLQYGEHVMSRADVSAGRQGPSTKIGQQMTVAEGAVQIIASDADSAGREAGWQLRKLAYV